MNERPDTERIKAQLAADVVRIIAEQKLSDTDACARLGLTQIELGRLRIADVAEISIELLIKALGEFEQQVTVEVTPASRTTADRRPIWEQIEEIVASIPPEAFEKLPTDLAANVDHYLYGAPKRD